MKGSTKIKLSVVILIILGLLTASIKAGIWNELWIAMPTWGFTEWFGAIMGELMILIVVCGLLDIMFPLDERAEFPILIFSIAFLSPIGWTIWLCIGLYKAWNKLMELSDKHLTD